MITPTFLMDMKPVDEVHISEGYTSINRKFAAIASEVLFLILPEPAFAFRDPFDGLGDPGLTGGIRFCIVKPFGIFLSEGG